MKKILLVALLLLVGLLAVLIVRTLQFTSKQMTQSPAEPVGLNVEEAAQRLSRAVQFQTISYQDASKFTAPEFKGLHDHLAAAFPRAHSTLKRETVSDYSLLYTWQGSDPQLPAVLLAAHMDVVPVDAASEPNWTHPPFAGQIAEGFIWGRGTMDDKVSVVGILEAVEALVAKGFQPRRTVYLAFGHDEEVSGLQGARQISALLSSRGVALDYILDEGGVIIEGLVPGVAAPVATIGIAEKGYATVALTVETEGGHSMSPPPSTAIGILSASIHRLEEQPFRARMDGATRKLFEYVGPEMGWSRRVLFANLWLFEPLIKDQLSRSPTTGATIRTTTAATIIEGGTKENVLPTRARAVVNFRILPGDTVAGVVEHVRRVVDDPRIQIAVEGNASEPSPVSDVEHASFKQLQQTIRQVFPEAVVAPYLMLGATDARHYESLTRNVYRFLPLRQKSEDIARFHGTNERVSVENYARLVEFYAQLLAGQ